MKFCLLVTVALDIFIKEKMILYIFLGFLLCHFSMQKASTRSNLCEKEWVTSQAFFQDHKRIFTLILVVVLVATLADR